jgi:hypothetical protein
MTIVDYENQGGFQEELSVVRNIGQDVTRLQRLMYARPHNSEESKAVYAVMTALNDLQGQIIHVRLKARRGESQ